MGNMKMHLSLAAVLILLSATACAATLAMPFYEGSGIRFTTDRYVRDIKARVPGARTLLLLVAARSINEPEYREQMAALSQVDSDALHLLIVTGSATSVDKQGYWLSSEDAATLLNKEHFRVVVVGDGGKVCLSSNAALKARQIATPDHALVPALARCANAGVPASR